MLTDTCKQALTRWMFSQAYEETGEDATTEEMELISVLENMLGDIGPFEGDLSVIIEAALKTVVEIEVIITEE
jgi:hypothetical protein